MVGKSARARFIIDRRGAGAASCRRETAARQRPLSPALRISIPGAFLLLPTALLRPSAPPVCRFSPRISAPSSFLLLRNCVSSAVQPRCQLTITPFRVYFSSLAAAKGFVLLNIRARRLAPLVVIVRGAQLFLAFLSLVSGSLRPFFVDKRCVFAVGCCVSVPVCGLFRSPGLRFSRFNASFRHLVWGFGGFAQRFRGLTPRCSGAVCRFASVHRAVVEKAHRFSTYPQFVFHSLFHGVEKMSTFPCVSPRLSVFPPPGAPMPSRRGEEKSPSRARIYNIGAEKGEKGSAPFAAFRGGRGLLGARVAERWFRPVGKGLTVGWGSQKGVGKCVGSGLPGAPVGVGRVKVVGRACSVCTRVATAGGEQGRHGRCACTIRAQF